MTYKQQDPVVQAAADWWVRLREADAGGEVIEQWLEWAGQDERHLETFERLNELAERLGGLDQVSRQGLIRAFARPAPPQRRWFPLAAAASIAAVMLSGALYVGWTHFAVVVTPQVVYQSGVGQNREFSLPDGTKVALGAASRLSVKYSNDQRSVEITDGEAYFNVVHDDRRPFVVTIGNMTVRDIGTAFDVRRTGERVTVAVTQGRVAISSRRLQVRPHSTLEATAGQRVTYDSDKSNFVVDIVTPAQATAWRQNRLEFIDEPLSVVVANLDRYASKPVHVADADLNALSYTGTIRTDAIDSWVDALPEVFPLRVSKQANGIVLSDARHATR
ncbi:FecR family protein [Dyella flagellata]|uniref:Iron dicitrate transporter FecR n=1 Tax=Dyella flagellata TaxID=1867833 RepID=A0ABQ5XBN6_9GAMM|nr:FecR domain-containing protein [Dyella flagellata]GLQ88069.1 iron dicitrate transporter FecR [Dyella flagellata]